ncbi:MAG: GWxTD domain-containing protein [candidate division KSB1 bacterium]|nr:GWxTD domain-containing protein [candidate division KSB1 bacterium]
MQHKLRLKKSTTVASMSLLLFLAYMSIASATNIGVLPLKSKGSIEFYLDVCQYEALQGGTRLEFIYSVDLSQFLNKADSLDQVAVFQIDFHVYGSLKDTLLASSEVKHVPLSPSTGGSGTIFLDVKKIETTADSLSLTLVISDSLSGKKGAITNSLLRKKFSDQLSISDLYFVSHIQKAIQPSAFEKSGLLMIPNPTRNFSYSVQAPNAYVYFEINHLGFKPENPSSYSVSYSVEDLSGKEVASHQRPTIPKTSANCSRVEIIPLADLKVGLYKLTLHVTDLPSGESASNWRYFSVASRDAAQDMLLSITEDNVQRYFDQIKYIATTEEKELFKKLNLRGKQEFLINFWQSKDPNPETAENEFMQEHFKRLAYAETSFSGGINSDMGRIYIQYGPPIEIKRQFSTTEFSKPVQIWYYAIQGTTEFVFVDRSGDGKYVLVHSTHPDEYQNPGWMNEMK